jgi:hypothetical protein
LVDDLAEIVGRDRVVRSAADAATDNGARRFTAPLRRRHRALETQPSTQPSTRPSTRPSTQPSTPPATQLATARASQAVRRFTAQVADQLAGDESVSAGWVEAMEAAARRRVADLPSALRAAVARTDLTVPPPRSWTTFAVARWCGLIAAVLGVGWLAVAIVTDANGPADSPGWLAPALLAAVGLVAWIVFGAVGMAGVRASSARTRAELAGRIDAAVDAAAAGLVVEPVEAELERLGHTRAALGDALRRR